jgi:hypothetical protein
MKERKLKIIKQAFEDALRMKADLEITFKNEIKELHVKMKKLESLNQDLESRVEDRQTIKEQ